MSQALPDMLGCPEADPPSVPHSESAPVARREARKAASIVGAIRLHDGTEIPCIVKDMSLSGAKLGIPGHCTLPERFMFKMHNRNLVFSVKLAWRRSRYAGVVIERIAKLHGKTPPRQAGAVIARRS